MRSLDRLRRRWHLPSFTTLGFGALLLLMLALTLLSTSAFLRLTGQRRRVADDAIREYASLGARLFGDRGYYLFESARMRILSSIYGTRVLPGQRPPSLENFAAHARETMDQIGFAIDDPNRGFFRLDAKSRAIEGTGAAASERIRNRIRELILTRPVPSDSRIEPMAWMMVNEPEPLTLGLATLHDAAGNEVAHYGFVYSRRRGWKSVGDAVMRELPLLPGTFIDPQYRFGLDASHSDSLVAIRLVDVNGRVIYDSRPPFPGSVEGKFTFNTGTGAFSAIETLHPALLASIRHSLQATRDAPFITYEMGGTIHTVRIPLEAMLPTVALLLAMLAGFGLWREQRLTRARRDFVASVSHELRTPLAQIRMFTETLLLRREQDEEERTRWLNIIGREARRLGDLVENILLFSHIDADRTKLERERTDLGELIEEIAEGYVPLAVQQRMHIVVDAPSRIFSLVDPRAMRQVVVNLLDNALKYGPAGQTVRIDLERIGSVARIVVTDEGPGIKHGDRNRMWQPFVRLGDQGTTGGSGIGLAVVRNLIVMHDGTIAVDDAPRGGARFTIELAVSDTTQGLSARETGEFSLRPGTGYTPHPGTIQAQPRKP